MICLFLEESRNSTKELVIRILAREWPLSVRQIHKRIRRSHGVNCSYHAVFKQVKKLVRRGIVSKKKHCYRINLEWCDEVDCFAKSVKENYQENPEGIIGRTSEEEKPNPEDSEVCLNS